MIDEYLRALEKRVDEMNKEIEAGNPNNRSTLELLQPYSILFNYVMIKIDSYTEEEKKAIIEERFFPGQLPKAEYPLTPDECIEPGKGYKTFVESKEVFTEESPLPNIPKCP